MQGNNGKSGAVESNGRRRILLGVGGLGAAGVVGAIGVGADRLTGFGDGASASAQSLWFAGLEQTALGDASLGTDSGSLVVSNVDGDGDDGVNIHIGETRGFMSRMTLDPEALPVGAYLHRTARGIVDGSSDSPIWNVRLRRAAGDAAFEATPNFQAIGSETYTLRLIADGQVVYEQGGHTEPTKLLQDEPTGLECCGFPPFYMYWEEYEAAASKISYVTPDGEEFEADRVDFAPDDVFVNDAVLTDVNVRGSGMPAFAMNDQLVGVHGRPHAANGDAHLTPRDAGTVLDVTNVAGSGDGVTAELDDVEGFLMSLDPLALEDGAAIHQTATGTIGGTPNQPLGVLTHENRGGELVVTADYADLDTDEVRIDVFDGEEHVNTIFSPPGEIVRIPRRPPITGCGKLPPWPLPCYIIDYFDRTEFEIGGGSGGGIIETGDELRVLAGEGESAVDSLSSFTLTGEGVDSFQIIDEQTGGGFV